METSIRERVSEHHIVTSARKKPRLHWNNLQGKLILPYALLTLVLAAIGTFVITLLVTSSIRERFVNQIYEASRFASDSFVRQERKQLDNLRLVVFTQGVPQAFEQRDSARLQELLSPVIANQHIEILTAVDVQGRELFTIGLNAEKNAYQVSAIGADFVSQAVVSKILQGVSDQEGDKYAQIIETGQGWVLFSSSPVKNEQGKLVGVLMVGAYLNSLTQDVKRSVQADLILFDREQTVIAASFDAPEEGYDFYRQGIEQGPIAGQSYIVDTMLNRRNYGMVYGPLVVRKQIVGWMGVLLPSNFIVATESTSRNLFALLFGLGTTGMAVIGFLLARNISTPILKLRHMTQRVANGDLSQSLHLKRSDEIGELAEAFDTMTLHLRERTAEAALLYAETLQRNKELAEINARLEATQLQLIQSEKLAAIGQLTAGIVHDVKNPFAVIKGMAEILSDNEQLDEQNRHFLKVISESAVKGNQIVSDLLKFARQSTPEMRYNDLNETMQTCLRLTAYLTRKYGPVCEMPERPIYSEYDSQQIEQVVINIIHNAVQAMPDNGILRIALRQVDRTAQIVIADTGKGIAPEHLSRIFDPFFTTKAEGEGTGLGLSVSYGIIKNHQGRIDVQSEVGKGTTFTIVLPITELVFSK